ncbi:MAG: hypothetical protein IB618_04215 [Candidatus Pacearchaeota archaeon]|nr:MAG: hypothetical protein IB618_04215 [Candidatus Pacearchaeota archaeon]
MVKKKSKKQFIKICPKCGSTKVKMPPAGMDLKLTFRDYCLDCRARGIFPEIEKTKVKDFQKKLKKKR